MAIGRPTKYTPELLEAAEAYASGKWEEAGDAVPTVVGLVLDLGISKSIAYDWAKDPEKKAFSDILTRIENLQERRLVNGGLENQFNPAITKMMLTKHGYSDKIEQDHTSSDGSMTPKEVSAFVIEGVPAKDDGTTD